MSTVIQDYLGDGVYAEYNGYAIVLKANDHKNPTDTIELDPDVLAALYRFVNRIPAERRATKSPPSGL